MGKPDGNTATGSARKRILSAVLEKAQQQRDAKAAAEAAEAAKLKQAENSLAASKQQVGAQAALAAERAAAEGRARDTAATGQAGVSVDIATADTAEDDSSPGGVKRRRQKFGIGTAPSGVNI